MNKAKVLPEMQARKTIKMLYKPNVIFNKLVFLVSKLGFELGFNRKFFPREIYPDDIYLVSFPKSGNTWLRFLIGNALTDNKCDFNNIGKIIPDIYRNRDECDYISRPRMMKSHLPYTPKMKRVIYLARDGRDVAVSYYFHLLKKKKLDKSITFDEYLLNFNKGFINPRVGSWSSHVLSWLNQSPVDHLLVKYEDLKKDTPSELKKLLEFIGLKKNENEISSVIVASDFKKMKAMEQKQSSSYHDFANTDSSIAFMRAGKVGGWSEYFSEQSEKEFLVWQGEALRRLDYIS